VSWPPAYGERFEPPASLVERNEASKLLFPGLATTPGLQRCAARTASKAERGECLSWAAGQTITIYDNNFNETGGFLEPLAGGLPLVGPDGSVVTIYGTIATNLTAACSLSLYAVQ
jgi:hypothetical protein